MDNLVPLATAAVTTLSMYLAKGAEEFVKAAGKDAFAKTKQFLAALRKRWASDEEAREQLTLFEGEPEHHQAALAEVLLKRLATDEDLVTLLKESLATPGPTVEITQRIRQAENVSALEVRHMASGTARVAQEIETGANIKCVDIDRLG